MMLAKLALMVATVMPCLTVAAATPAPDSPNISGHLDDDKIVLEGTLARPDSQGASPNSQQAAALPSAPPMESRRVIACAGNSIDDPRTELCANAMTLCVGKPGVGALTRIYQRPAGSTEPWQLAEETCDPDAVEGPAARDTTLADIEREFAATPLASPGATLQPPGNTTLVTLPVYFTATWPHADTAGAGYRPGQTRTLTLLGHRVDLTITLAHFVYGYGDGADSGPTSSPGGPYPGGDITHAYPRAGTYTPTITAVLTASYRIDGGPPRRIASTATRAATLPTLTVLTARNRLLDPSATRPE